MKWMSAWITLAVLAASAAMAADDSTLLCPDQPSGVHIRAENRYYEITPSIVPADQETVITIKPLFKHGNFQDGATYTIAYYPINQLAEKSGWKPDVKTPVTPADGKVEFRMLFEGEQEHALILEETKGDKRRVLGDFRIYSLNPDLFSLRPYKGDFHLHSNRSDGVEAPAYVAGICRRAGLDFMGLSDHRNYAGWQEAYDAFKDAPIDLRIYPSEEVHPPDTPVHFVSFGADAGITQFYADEAAYKNEINAFAATLPETPAGVNRFQFASSVWIFNKIREHGGLGMLCHIYWQPGHRNYISESLITQLFDAQPFDALELISGFGWNELNAVDVNNLQVNRYNEERAKGKKIPVCGISDSHGQERSDSFGRYYTVCFAPTIELKDIIASIKGLNSVAVEAVAGELPRAYGPFRLVRYTQFLLHNVFPQHDELCFEEGRLMIRMAAGDADANARLAAAKGQVDRLYAQYWAATK